MIARLPRPAASPISARIDPRLLHVPGGTKGFDPLRGTYDDRTYLRFRVR